MDAGDKGAGPKLAEDKDAGDQPVPRGVLRLFVPASVDAYIPLRAGGLRGTPGSVCHFCILVNGFHSFGRYAGTAKIVALVGG